MVVARPGYVWSGTEWVPIGVAPEGSSPTDHEQLTGRTSPSQHPVDSIDGLQTALDGKAPTVHVHPDETTLTGGDGIEVLQTGTDWGVRNTDTGSGAVSVHEQDPVAHPGQFTPGSHTDDAAPHSGVLAPEGHTHDGYEVAGTAAIGDAAHVADVDAHPDYLSATEVIGGPGIQVDTTAEGGALVTATSQGGVVPVHGYAANQVGGSQNLATNTWTKLIYSNVILSGLDCTQEPTGGLRMGPNAPAGWYDIFYVMGTVGTSGVGNRRMRALVNGVVDDTLLPQVQIEAVSNSAISTVFEGVGMRYLVPYDLIQIEGFQSSGGTLSTSELNTMLAVVYRGPQAGLNVTAVPDPAAGEALFSYATMTTTPASTNNTFENALLNSMPISSLPATLLPDGSYRCDVDWLDGWYDIEGMAIYSGNVTGTRGARIQVNGLQPEGGPALTNVAPPPDSARPGGCLYRAMAYLKAGDVVALQGRQQSGTALTWNVGTYMTVRWAGYGSDPNPGDLRVDLLPAPPEEN